MSESKRPGVRDISDLKARLGLKKGPAKRKGGVVPPPGVKGVPAPPGAQQPAGPKVSEDPFGALNAAAQTAPAQPQEQIVVKIDRDEEIESVERKALGIKIAKYAGVMLIPLIIGVAVGQIGTNAKQYNKTINDSGTVADEIKKVRQSMRDYQHAFSKAKKGGFAVFDEDLTKKLDKVAFHSPDPDIIYKSHVYELDPNLVGDVLYFASEASKLSKQIKAHVTLTKRDMKNLKLAKSKKKESEAPESESGQKHGKYRFAILTQVPGEEDAAKNPYGAKVVEIGMPICGGDVSETGDCDLPLTGFRYRTGPDEPWQSGDIAQVQAGADAVPAGKLIPLLGTGTVETMIRGTDPSFAEKEYTERVMSLAEKTEELVKLATSLEGALKAKAGEGEKFTFFM